MDGKIVAELFGQVVLLAAAAYLVEDAVEGGSRVDATPARPNDLFGILPRTVSTPRPQRHQQCRGRADLAERQVRIFPPGASDRTH
jgi:hypothetical protein